MTETKVKEKELRGDKFISYKMENYFTMYTAFSEGKKPTAAG